MPLTGQDLVDEARGWLGTPFLHGGRVKGLGCDCAGLILGAARACGIVIEEPPGYNRIIDPALVLAGVANCCAPIPFTALEAEPGDVLLFAWKGQAIHLGLATGTGSFIHSYEVVGKVIETPLDRYWQTWCAGAFRWRELEEA
jgi:NlpC/P60 family putative phage cell wall peptidase